MSKKRNRHTEKFKAQVALEAVKGNQTLQELAAQYGVAPGQISEWKEQLLRGAAHVFVREDEQNEQLKQLKEKVSNLEQLVEQREYELSWLTKRQ